MGLKNRIDEIRARMDRIDARMGPMLRWTIGLILGMRASIMLMLIPILLKLLGAI